MLNILGSFVGAKVVVTSEFGTAIDDPFSRSAP
jgi:hypothetical protein